MTSINSYQRHLDADQLRAVLAASGVRPESLAQWTELGEATYNTAYRLRLDTGAGLVLKVAPDPTMPAMSYEHDIMRTETLFYRTAAEVAPVPAVVNADFSRTLIDTDYLLMAELPGQNWYAQRDQLDQEPLRRELGEIIAALHTVTGNGFGYPQDPPASTWREAFTGMVGALLADAQRFSSALPRSVAEIKDLFAANENVLDDVSTPVLVHFDLWPGNILVESGRITGLVDGERAFWGDPLAEMVSLALFGDIEKDPVFLAGYGGIAFDTSARLRLAMYRAYLYLIMLIEGTPRGYSGPDRDSLVKYTEVHLLKALAGLKP